MKLYFFLLLFSFLGFSSPGFSKVGMLIIKSNGTGVYKKPSFDSKVLGTLKKGKKVYGVLEPQEAIDGFGLFHKIRIKKGFYGYILDTAVKGFKPTGVLNKKSQDGGGTLRKKKRKPKKTTRNRFISIPYSKALGFTYSNLKYEAKFINTKESSNESFFGVKASGPWFLNAPLDISLSFSPSSPKFFDELTQSHSGFIGFLEVSAPFEFKKGRNWSVFGGLGAFASHYSYELEFTGRVQKDKSSKTGFGVSGALGAGTTYKNYVFKLEGKYLYEKQGHYGLVLSVQRFF